ncbi:MAG: TonB family protein [Leadbetterella sp.]
MQINIPEPCSEDWNAMKIGFNSRFCASCSKNVMDFTNISRRGILEYLFVNHNKNACGRIRDSQLNFVNLDYIETIQALSKKHRNTNFSFFLLTLGTLLLAGCDFPSSNKKISKAEFELALRKDKESKVIGRGSCPELQYQNKCDIDSLDQKTTIGRVQPKISEGHTMGDFEMAEKIDILPEFKGGIASLHKFIKSNLNYPTKEKVDKLEGEVYVTFMVTKTGEILNPQILGSDTQSKNMEIEAIRIVKLMPNWKPGQLKGKAIDYQFNMPIRFKL